ncbi:CHRD domain-containing protein [Mumia sp. Pv 4-285]|uniref:CHRD domain-containing protein n=1 Tax=Mumia qirimensis TaxID=3234852 RepID=UPI00351CCCD8
MVSKAGPVAAAAVIFVSGAAGVTMVKGDAGASGKRTALTGYEEVPALSTAAGGTFRSTIARDRSTIRYRLTYGGLETSVTQAHIHFGQKGVNGGVSVFLCTNLGNGPAGTQACPQAGSVRGVIDAADVVGPAGQGIAAGEFDELIRAIRAGTAYVNVHSQAYPGGEIRAQLPGKKHKHGHHH